MKFRREIISISGRKFSIEIPEHIIRLLLVHTDNRTEYEFTPWLASEVSSFLRSMIPADERPSSERQINYAVKISETLGEELPNDIYDSDVCGRYISENEDRFKEAEKEIREADKLFRYLIKQTRRVSRWNQARVMLESGKSVDDVSVEMGVKSPTVMKYLDELKAWETEALGTEEYKVVQSLTEEYESGIDLYEKYLYKQFY